MSAATTAQPLPECLLCETPTRRQVYEANGGVCSACLTGAVQFRTPRRAR